MAYKLNPGDNMYSVSKIFKCSIAERNWMKGEPDAYIRGRDLYDFTVMNPEFQIHGHSMYIKVTIEGKTLDDIGFVIDTDVVKELMKDKVNSLDHTFLIHNKDPIFRHIYELSKTNKIKLYVTDYVISYENVSKDIYDYCSSKLKEHNFDKFARVKSINVYTQTIGGSYCED